MIHVVERTMPAGVRLAVIGASVAVAWAAVCLVVGAVSPSSATSDVSDLGVGQTTEISEALAPVVAPIAPAVPVEPVIAPIVEPVMAIVPPAAGAVVAVVTPATSVLVSATAPMADLVAPATDAVVDIVVTPAPFDSTVKLPVLAAMSVPGQSGTFTGSSTVASFSPGAFADAVRDSATTGARSARRQHPS